MPEAMDKHARNVERIIQQGGSKEDVQTYLDGFGVSDTDVLGAAKGLLGKATDVIGGAVSAVGEMVHGKTDPAFEGVPGFSGQGLSDPEAIGPVMRGKMVTYDDAAYGDIVKNALGDRLLKTEQDQHGQEVITYVGDDGEVYRSYVNAPGLDVQDVDRAVSGAVPFVLGGGAATGAARALGGSLWTRVGTQAAAGGAASVGADVAAQREGSEQPIDLIRAGIAAGGAGLFERMAGPAQALWRRIFIKPAIVDDTGRLTQKGRAEALKAGLDPDDMDERLSGLVADRFSVARDKAEAAAGARVGEFGIPATKGQRTKQPDILQMEQEMRRGLWGREARDIISEFDKSQAKAIDDAVYETVGGRVAPQAGGREQATLGQSIQGAARLAREAADEMENKLWGRLGPMYPRTDAFETLPAHVQHELGRFGMTPSQSATPKTFEALGMLEQYAQGRAHTAKVPLIGQGPEKRSLDSMRRELWTRVQSAEPGTPDRLAMNSIYQAYNKWIDDIAEKAMVHGSPDAVAQLKVARGFTREMKALFEPKDKSGRLSAAGKRIQKVLDDVDSPEGVINQLFGAAGPTAAPPQGANGALLHMKRILSGKTASGGAWDDIRLAYWVKLAQDNKGRVLSPNNLKNRIDQAFSNQRSVLDTLYNEKERGLMRRLSAALEDATWVDPNPSGTSYALQLMRRRPLGDMAKLAARTQSQRETFSKHNILAARMYQLLAKTLPGSALGVGERAGRKAAERMTGQAVTPRVPTSGGLGGYLSVEGVSD